MKRKKSSSVGRRRSTVSKTYEMKVHDLTVQVSRRKIKNVNLYIQPGKINVLVTAPSYIDDQYIMDFLERKYDWMITHINRMNQKKQVVKTEITLEERQHLQSLIELYANKWEPIMGVHCVKWTIRDMKTRWGSCSVSKATIRINLQLAKKSPECVEYIIVHELTHLLEASHNKVFKAYMTKFLPDWKERDKVLRQS